MGLFKGDLKTLKLIAIYGGAASLLGAGYLSTRIQGSTVVTHLPHKSVLRVNSGRALTQSNTFTLLTLFHKLAVASELFKPVNRTNHLFSMNL